MTKLSDSHPALCREVLRFPGGIHAVRVAGEGSYRVILKLPPSYILPAKVNRGFRIYVVPVSVGESATVGLMSAFIDDADCPLFSWRLLDEGTETADLVYALLRPEVLVHIFDEHNREFLGYRARLEVPLMARVRLEHAAFVVPDHAQAHAAQEMAEVWFALRGEQDDCEAIRVSFGQPLFAEDLPISDDPAASPGFRGDPGPGFTMLEREQPGPFQEIDIILALRRVYAAEQIFHGPRRFYDREEIADVVVITDYACLIVQAKDSPNTPGTLKRTLARKRAKSISMVTEALGQARGAINYLHRYRPLTMLVDGEAVTIDLAGRQIVSLVVVRELFRDAYAEYSKALFGFLGDVGLPCIALDIAELHEFTTFCPNEAAFLGAYFEVFDMAQELGEFPRLRFGLRDVEALWAGSSAASDIPDDVAD